MLLHLLGCGPGISDDGSLGDLDGLAFQGLLSDADLGLFVRVTDEDATMRAMFAREDGTLGASVELTDGLQYLHEWTWVTFDGPQTKDVDSLTIANGSITGYVELDGTRLNFEGTLNNPRTQLETDVEFVGTILLTTWTSPPQETDSQDTADSADTADDSS